MHRVNDCGINGSLSGSNALDRNFEYDPLYRVISADGRESDTQNQNDYLYSDAPAPGTPNANNVRSYTRKYTFDKLGNIQQLKQLGTNGFTRNFTYNAGHNTLQKVETPTPTLIEDFTYDACGNQLTAGTTRHYVWNAGNQLVTYYNQAGSAEPTIFAQYDYSGMNRVSKLVKTGTTYQRTIYIDGIFEYHKLENGTTYEKNYVHIMDDQSRIAMVRVGTPFPDDIADAITYNIEDQIGSSSVRLNSYGTVIDREEYYPYGDSSLRTFTKKRYRYVGKEKDLESGLYYYGARYYLAWTCRFISVDPLAHDYPFYTPYNYAGNKPINRVDIDGMQEGEQTTEVVSVGIPTTFKDKNGIEVNQIPEVVQKMFQQEYGITLGYENGKLFKAGDYATNLTISTDAKNEWETALSSENNNISMMFGYELALSLLPTKGGMGELSNPVVKGEYSSLQKKAYIDLADFNSEGIQLGASVIGVGDGNSFSMRSDNLARVMEHEYIGHGVFELTDEGYNGLGEVENLLNNYRRQMGLYERDSYEYSINKYQLNFMNPEKSIYRVGLNFGNNKYTMTFDRVPMTKMKFYVQ